jgi:hypothetical protein
VRTVAAIPAAALVAGAACGLLVPDPPYVLAYVLLSTSVAGAMFGWARRRPRWLACAVALGFFAGGLLLASVEWQRAWRPPLRIAFERLAREVRAEAAREHRRLPEDDEAFAIVEGILRADAAPSAGGVSLSLAVDRIEDPVYPARPVNPPDLPHQPHPTATGGLLVTVAGALAPPRMPEWRAGRRVRFPVQLHRPSRYLNDGVPDGERALARRGATLVGSVKSGALVELVARGAVVRRMARHGAARCAQSDRRRRHPLESPIGRHRLRHRHRRSRPASTTRSSAGCRRPAPTM